MANGDLPEPPGSADANDRRPQLTAISFAYQKDWLNLRKSEPAPDANSEAAK